MYYGKTRSLATSAKIGLELLIWSVCLGPKSFHLFVCSPPDYLIISLFAVLSVIYELFSGEQAVLQMRSVAQMF